MAKTHDIFKFKSAFRELQQHEEALDWGRHEDVDEEDDSDDGYEEFQRLSAECEQLEEELGEIDDPPGANPAELLALDTARRLAAYELTNTRPVEGRAAIDALILLVEIVQRAIELRGIRYPAELTDAETDALDIIRARATLAITNSDKNAADVATGELRTALADLMRAPSAEVLKLRLAAALDANRAAVARGLYVRMVADEMEIPGAYNIKLRQLGIIPRRDMGAGGALVPETREGGRHAWARHTREGIWDARRVLTAHPNRVAIFTDEGRLDQALNDTPTARNKWRETGGGRVDSDESNVHYQAVLLGTDVDLFSCYPVGNSAAGRQFPRRDVEDALANAHSFDEFCEALDQL